MDEKCTYSEKNKNSNNKEAEVKLFWEQIKRDVSTINSKYQNSSIPLSVAKEDNIELLEYNFNNIEFPESPKGSLPFYDLNKDININFKDCHFQGSINFSQLFKAKNISFEECYFYEDIEFQSNEYENMFFFQNCRVYKKATFRNIIFHETTSFIKTRFYDELKFSIVKFKKMALFNEMRIKKLDLTNTFFEDESNFLDIKNEAGKKLEAENIANRETARIIKHSFDKIGNIIEANKFYALEMDKREEELKDKDDKDNNFLESLVFKFHKISSNHSQDWLLSFLWIVFTTFLFNFLSTTISYTLDIACSMLFLFSVIFIFSIASKHFLGSFQKSIVTFLILLFYYYNNVSLELFAEKLNPFSIMTIEKLTIDLLIYKVIIAYLIYQFIVSVRQNTRRK